MSRGERTSEERERARLERAARRAQREGRPPPVAPPPTEVPPPDMDDGAGAGEPVIEKERVFEPVRPLRVPQPPRVEEPLAAPEPPLTEEPLTEEPLPEEPLTEEPLPEEPLPEEPPLPEPPLPEEPLPEEPLPEEPPSVREPAAWEPADPPESERETEETPAIAGPPDVADVPVEAFPVLRDESPLWTDEPGELGEEPPVEIGEATEAHRQSPVEDGEPAWTADHVELGSAEDEEERGEAAEDEPGWVEEESTWVEGEAKSESVEGDAEPEWVENDAEPEWVENEAGPARDDEAEGPAGVETEEEPAWIENEAEPARDEEAEGPAGVETEEEPAWVEDGEPVPVEGGEYGWPEDGEPALADDHEPPPHPGPVEGTQPRQGPRALPPFPGAAAEERGDAGQPAAPSRRRRRPARRVLAVVALLVVGVAGWFLVSLFQPFADGGEGSVAVTIPQGSGVASIAALLERRGVVDDAFFFRARATLSGRGADFKAGDFQLKRDMSYAAAMDALVDSPDANTLTVTIPEGRARREVKRTVADTLEGDYLAASRRSPVLDPKSYRAGSVRSLEGFLFPATYELERGAVANDLVREQLRTFKREFEKVDLGFARRKNLTPYDVLIIASMVEREAQVARERPLIASVIYNRLSEGTPLGIDATIRFATNNWSKPLTQSELAIDSPYNTRRQHGLPPGPIGSPGLDAIRAAARPRQTDFLYFVVKPGTCGEHAFSKTDAQFQRDVQRYNSQRAERGGRSPTDCR